MCAHVPCTFYDDSLLLDDHITVYGYWFRDGTHAIRGSPMATNNLFRWVEEHAEGRFHLLGDPSMNNCSLSITDAQSSDRGYYFFRFEKGNVKYSYRNPLLYVNVTDLIQKPDISVPEMLESGNPVTLNCTFPWTCGENRSFKFSWMGAALSSKSESSGVSHFSEISFIPEPQHHGTKLTCQVTLPGGRLNRKRTIQLNVSYAVQNVSITVTQDNRTTVFIPENSSALLVQEGQSLLLLCATNSNPPAALNWILRDQTLASSQPSDNGILHLDLPQLKPEDGGNYTCLAQHHLGSKQASLNISVQYAPRILRPSCSWVKEGLLCTCSVQAEPAPSLRWWVGGKPVEGNTSNDTFQVTSNRSGPWANSSLSVKMERVPNITLSCEGKNPQGTHTVLFHLAPDKSATPLVFQKSMILGVLCGAGTTGLLALCLLLILVKMLRKKSVVAAAGEESRARVEDPKRPSWEDLSLDPISPAADIAPTPAAPEDGLDESHYACLNFQGAKVREDHVSTEPLTEYSEIKFK
ncbi:sialic acid-binding Ig-like lectin 10 [Trichosurus vulpecula]|uniref:sialic acid-binding Ig-like lectin 10 n=1 Tax=Trichosurus vulpecula TaxID=9337 RepID=UPI00186AE7CB|nr:sialic acid-binding Ig-like lectin 10 [Trichosurus vulpecula]